MNTVPRSAILFSNNRADELKPAVQLVQSIDNRLESFIEVIQAAKGQKERDQREASSEAMASKPSLMSGFGDKTKRIVGSLVGKLTQFALVVLAPLILPLIIGLNNAFPKVHQIFEGIGLAIRDPAEGINRAVDFFVGSIDKIKEAFSYLADSALEIVDNIARISEIIFVSMKAELLNMAANVLDKITDPNSRIGKALKAVGADKAVRVASSGIRQSATDSSSRAEELRTAPRVRRSWRDTDGGKLITGQYGHLEFGPNGIPRWAKPEQRVDLISRPSVGSSSSTGSSVSPQMKGLLDYIAKYEGPAGYSGVYGDGPAGPTWPDLQTKTLREAMRLQSTIRKPKSQGGLGRESSAIGRYQFMPDTLNDLIRKMGLNPDREIFSPALQDRMAVELMKQQGLNAYLSGRMSPADFEMNLAKIWAALPAPYNTTRTSKGKPVAVTAGESYYGGVGANRKTTAARVSDFDATVSSLRSTSPTQSVSSIPSASSTQMVTPKPIVATVPPQMVVVPSMPPARRPQAPSGSTPIDPNAVRSSYRSALGGR